MFAVSKTGETVDVSVRNLYKAAHACPLLHIYDNKEEGKQNFTVIYLITLIVRSSKITIIRRTTGFIPS